MTRYADGTTVSIDRSRAEVENLLHRYGADKFMYYREGDSTTIAFEMEGRACRLQVRPPDRGLFALTPQGRRRTPVAAGEAWDAEYRRRWRVLVLSIKARLESIAAEAETFEEAFAGVMLLRSGRTLSEEMRDNPQALGAFNGAGLLAAPKNGG